jgi:hypothetical protein
MVESDNISSNSDIPNQEPVQLSLKVLSRLVSVFRDHVSYQDVCQLLSFEETQRDANVVEFYTVAVRISLMLGQASTNVELGLSCISLTTKEIQKHAWTSSFNCFQNELRLQLEEMGYLSHYFSFSLFPIGQQQGNEIASDLYLCMRVGRRDEQDGGGAGIYGQADIDPKKIHGKMTSVGFAL